MGESRYAPVIEEDKVGSNAGRAKAVDRAIAERKTNSIPHSNVHPSMPKTSSLGTPASRAPQRGFGRRGLSPEKMR
jgi:hypothetical protein